MCWKYSLQVNFVSYNIYYNLGDTCSGLCEPKSHQGWCFGYVCLAPFARNAQIGSYTKPYMVHLLYQRSSSNLFRTSYSQKSTLVFLAIIR